MRRPWSSSLIWTLPLLAGGACGVPDFSGFDSTGHSDAGLDAPHEASGGSSGLGGTGGTSGGTGGTNAEAGDAPSSCTSDAQCSGDTPRCDKVSGACVACLPSDDQCPAGQFCTGAFTCTLGCKVAAECNIDGGAGPLTCTKGKCVGCQSDDDCAPGKVCDPTSTACVPGCTAQHACQSGYDCCSGSCALLAFDVNHCGTCDTVCDPNPPNATPKCAAGKCGLDCAFQHANCNGILSDGCEVDVTTDSQNCNGCKNVCPSGQTCTNAKCG